MIRLRQTHGADAGRELALDQELIRIGRMPDSDVTFDPEVDLDASGRHAEIRSEDGRYLLIDTGSRNGTWINGQRIKHVALHEGDQIEFGRGGPTLVVVSVQHRSSREPTVPMPVSPRREPKFDPLAMPVTTATRLEDLAREEARSRHAASGDRLDPPPREPLPPSRPGSAAWWIAGAFFVIVLAVVAVLR